MRILIKEKPLSRSSAVLLLFFFVFVVWFKDISVAFRQGVFVRSGFFVAVPVDPFPEGGKRGDAHRQSGGKTQRFVDVHRREANAHEGIYENGYDGQDALGLCAEDDRLPVVVPSQDETVDDERDGAGHPPSDKVMDRLVEEGASVRPDPETVLGKTEIGFVLYRRQ